MPTLIYCLALAVLIQRPKQEDMARDTARDRTCTSRHCGTSGNIVLWARSRTSCPPLSRSGSDMTFHLAFLIRMELKESFSDIEC